MRILFAGGGTGGHLYPGLAIARAMRRASSAVDPFFVGALRGIEKEVLPRTEFPHELLDLHPLYRSRPWENWKTIRGALSGWGRLKRIVKSVPPSVVVGTGGYASGLALGYARMHGIPYVVQEQNSYPGLTTRFFARHARQVHLGFPEAASHLKPGKDTQVLDTGNPIEPPPSPRPDREDAREAWGFPANGGRVMLVYGGSQGSKAINDVVAAWIEQGIPDNLFVIWATGRKNYSAYEHFESERIKVRPYLSPVSEAYAASDFALSRGGAMATAELCAWGIPPIIVPLPTAAADHQTANARALSAAGAGEMIIQSAFSPETLDSSVKKLLETPSLLEQRSEAVLVRSRPHAADTIAQRILSIVKS
ncbi:MAG TPA: UDP-N-acetylglucosamine--N-acetylmuramyl-(pentapeptide) pyrophosphoryl-undecaprenol N-acetylglucosamine transferase [Gemmatimonadaceae bacterium]|nr:UDP-N-acetylglucosamine--N-acetylmuramyl-(pentapeptide) pyrophosphoryl-undecaprenol N-acetylglucosamine transferase [Gemmatimonadaceae bacterium]